MPSGCASPWVPSLAHEEKGEKMMRERKEEAKEHKNSAELNKQKVLALVSFGNFKMPIDVPRQ